MVTEDKCDCVYKGKHIAASTYYINHKENTSNTDEEQQWGIPSAKRFTKEKYFGQMFTPKKIPTSEYHPYSYQNK